MLDPDDIMWSCGNHIFSGDHDSLVAIVFDKYTDKIHVLSASNEMYEALEELEKLDFCTNGSPKQIRAAVLKARNALAKARGNIQ